MAAAEPGSAFNDPITWVNFGVLGLVVLGFLTGRICTGRDRDQLRGERDKAYAQRDAMAEVLQERLLPVVSEFITTTRALLPVLQEVRRLQEFIDKANAPPGQGGQR